MKEIILKSYERYSLLEGEIFILKKGKVITKSIASTGKIINNNTFLKEGEILFNWFGFYNEENTLEIEVEALENSILEKIEFPKTKNQNLYQTMLFQLMRKNILEVQYHLYNTKGYILATLKKFVCDNGALDKRIMKPEYFNIGKSQFYKIYKEIKEDGFLIEKNEKIYLEFNKIKKYLKGLENDR